MSDGFCEMIDTARLFFAQLAANNTREWFEPRKDRYVQEIRKPADILAEVLAEDLSRATGAAHRPKLFRIHSDVRFYKVITPIYA